MCILRAHYRSGKNRSFYYRPSKEIASQGIFTNPALTSFTITFDNTACQFAIDVHTTPLATNTWRFTASGQVYRGSDQVINVVFANVSTGDDGFSANGL